MINYLILTYVLSQMFTILFDFKKYIPYTVIQFLMSKLYCWKCLSFWLTLIATGNIFLASQVSLLAIIIEDLLPTIVSVTDKLKNKLNI